MEKKPGADPEAAARAERIHEQIDKIKRGERGDNSAGSDPDGRPPMSPRDFIHKRMRELNKKKDE
jgi:hypothetical protein